VTDLADRNLILYAAGYSEAGVTGEDYESLKELKDFGVFIVSAVIMGLDSEGKVRVRDKEYIVGGGAVAGGPWASSSGCSLLRCWQPRPSVPVSGPPWGAWSSTTVRAS
jgi:uncharacterized membrane protein